MKLNNKNLKLTLCSLTAIAFSQSSCVIKRAYAYYTLSMPGMIFTDDKGNPVDPVPSITRTVFIECSGNKMPVIDNILYNNIPQKNELSRVQGPKVIVGKHQENGHDFELTGQKGYTLWKVDIYPADENKRVSQDCKNIIIKSRSGKKSCKTILYKETALMPMPRY